MGAFMAEPLFSREALVGAKHVFFRFPWSVRFQEVDAAGIVFFPRILEACHTAYVQFCLQRGGPAAEETWRSRRWTVPLVHAEADFLHPLRFLDEVSIEVVGHLHTDRKIAWGFRLMLENQVAAVAHTVHVVVDSTTFQRVDVPAEIKAMVALMLGESHG